MKAVVGAFNQEKALVGAFSVIVQLHRFAALLITIVVEQPRGLGGFELELYGVPGRQDGLAGPAPGTQLVLDSFSAAEHGFCHLHFCTN